MTETSSSNRRGFLSTVATAGAAAALTGCAGLTASAAAAKPLNTGGSNWDYSWLDKLAGPRSAIFDAATIEAGIGIAHSGYYLDAIKEAFGADPKVVLVIRHTATPMIFNSAMWEKYAIGASEKINRPADGPPAIVNVFAERIAALQARGVIVLGCDVALSGLAFRYARATNVQRDTVAADLRANIVSGVLLQPVGVMASQLAQHAGCSYVRSS